MQGKFGQALRNPLDVTSYKPIRLTSAVPASNPMTSMVSLLPAIKPNLSQSDRILIIAADLTDAYGRPIDGNDDGVPGGNYVAILSRSGVTFGAVPLVLAWTTGKPTATSAVVDALLARDELASVTRAHRPRREPVAAVRRRYGLRHGVATFEEDECRCPQRPARLAQQRPGPCRRLVPLVRPFQERQDAHRI